MTSNPARPKRAAEDFARTHDPDLSLNSNDSAMPQSKKPRFDLRNPSALAPDALEDDAVLDADVIGGGRGQNVRRNAVNIDGYESDSENEGFDGRVAAKARREQEEKSRLEEENDMFADLEADFRDEGSEERPGDRGKKAVRFLEEDEIEGQEETSKAGGHVKADFFAARSETQNESRKGKGRDEDVESSSESEVDDETRAALDNNVDAELGAGGKKAHAPKLDAFNMRAEQEEGRFDDQGNYVRKAADPDAIHDTWLEGLSKKDMRRAKEAAERRETERRQRDVEDDSVLTSDLLRTLISHLEKGETLLEALARLGKARDRKPKWHTKSKNRRKSDTSHEFEMIQDDPDELRRRETIETITDAADRLLTRGQPDIYDTERELLIRQYQKETGDEWVEAEDNDGHENGSIVKSWEYRWSDSRDGGQIHGPYDGDTMKQWNDAGYFGDGVEFREKNSAHPWSRVVDFT